MLRFFQNLKIWIFGKFFKFFDLDLEKKSTILDGFFPYLAQMITSMRGCVAYNDLWPWPISSRSFGLVLENLVRSVASTVLDGFFPYLVQMITSMRRCVACDDIWPWPISSRSFDLDFENRVRSAMFSVLDRLFPYLAQIIISIKGCVTCNDLWPWPICSRSFGLDFENRVRSVASTVLDGFFPYLVQMITSMRRCVACDDLWPWPISSRSFYLDFENRVWGGGYPRRWHRLIYLVFSIFSSLFEYEEWCLCILFSIFILPASTKLKGGVYWYHLVRLSICGQNHVCSVSSTILIGSISYLHILSGNFRRCVACNARFKIEKFEILTNFLNL